MTEEELQEHIQRLRRRKTVELEQVKLLRTWLDRKRNSRQSCRVIGPSRAGKTFACKAYLKERSPLDTQNQHPTAPVIYIEPGQDCSARELCRAILESLGFAIPKGTLGDVRNRTYKVLSECKVEQLIIDEADRLPKKTFVDVRDIYDKLEISVALVGTGNLDNVLNKDIQVYNRFRACYPFGTLPKEQFKLTVQIWERDILQLPVASNLGNKRILDILNDKTERYIGRLDELLREAAIRALEKRLMKIDIATLNEVVAEFK